MKNSCCGRLLAFVLWPGLLQLSACRPHSSAQASCPGWAVEHPPTDAFDMDARLPELTQDTSVTTELSYAQRQLLLHDAYQINCCLAADAMHDSTYVGAYGYSTVGRLSRNPGAPCHLLVRASMDDFSGLYLVLRSPQQTYHSLYVAGIDGSGSTEGGFYRSWFTTTGRMLNDTLVQVKTSIEFLAFRETRQQSYTDTTTEVFRIDYRTATFQQLSSTTRTTKLPGKFIN